MLRSMLGYWNLFVNYLRQKNYGQRQKKNNQKLNKRQSLEPKPADEATDK